MSSPSSFSSSSPSSSFSSFSSSWSSSSWWVLACVCVCVCVPVCVLVCVVGLACLSLSRGPCGVLVAGLAGSGPGVAPFGPRGWGWAGLGVLGGGRAHASPIILPNGFLQNCETFESCNSFAFFVLFSALVGQALCKSLLRQFSAVWVSHWRLSNDLIFIPCVNSSFF